LKTKIILGVVTIAVAGYGAWRWFAPVLTQRARVTPAQTQPIATKRLAPEGTFFLLKRASLTIDSGVIGFAPGTKVTLVEQADSVSTVTDGEYQFKVPSSQLTNDMDLAASIAKADQTTQAQIAGSTAKWTQEYKQRQRNAFIASEEEKAQKKTGQKTPRRPSPTPKR
jgi:hypothetical protein